MGLLREVVYPWMRRCPTEKGTQKMFLCDVGVSERDRRGWKLGSPPLLVHPGDVASMLEGDSAMTSSGRGGAPGSPGFGRLEEVEEGAAVRLAPAMEGRSPHFCNEGERELARSEVEGLLSPSGWNRRVELFEKVLGRSVVVVRLLKLLSEDELEAPAALRDSIFSFLAFCTSSVILAMMKFWERISRMESISASRPRGFSARMSSSVAVLLVCVDLQLISSASSRVNILRERK